MRAKTPISELFYPAPEQWGLRGDPFLWREMASAFRGVPAPDLPQPLARSCGGGRISDESRREGPTTPVPLPPGPVHRAYRHQARNNELQALIDYLKSVVNYETAQIAPLAGGAGVSVVSTAGAGFGAGAGAAGNAAGGQQQRQQ
jgi:hypothetical protein